MKNLKYIFGLVVITSLISCNDKRTPQVQYMPDMYESIPYDANGANGINNAPVNSKPVAGTIARGGQPAYDIPDTPEGYELAKLFVESGLKVDNEVFVKIYELAKS